MPFKKNLPIPKRQRSVGERIVQLLELAALARTVSKVVGRRKSSRVPGGKRGLLALVGGAVLAVVIGRLLAKKSSGGSDAPAPQSAATPTPTPAPTTASEPPTTAPEPPAPESEPVKAAVAAAEKLNDIDGAGDGATVEQPAVTDTAPDDENAG